MKLGKILKYAGIIVGVIALAVLIWITVAKLWPIIVVLGLGAVAWFVGAWFEKKGK
jgi:hypothetical protein